MDVVDEALCFAHTLAGRPCGEWQSWLAHAEGVAARCERFAEAFGSASAGRWLGLAHDLGKRKAAFQAYLKGQGVGCSHAYEGARWLDEQVRGLGRLLAYAVAGHHTGLPDGVGDATSLVSHLGRDAAQVALGREAPDPKALAPGWLFGGGPTHLWLWVKMLFSCLVDADWLDTEAFMDPARAAGRLTDFEDLETLLARFRGHMEGLSAGASRTPVNALRERVLRAVLARAGAGRPGFYSLTVPTGGGKTLASLGFALRHAVANGQRKVIYAVPFSTIIEQTSGIFARVLGEGNVLEHHAEARWREAGAEVAMPQRLLTENWEGVPVVVTTNVQFFESFFSAQTSRCRKLHNVAGSVIVLDEAQKLPERFLAPCVALLRLLVSDYGCTVLFCTATQPNLRSFGVAPAELAPDVAGLYKALRRVDYHVLGRVEWETLADHIAGRPSALCVVNTKQDARDLFAALVGRVGKDAFHLSTWMCPQHRRDAIAEIRRRLAGGLPVYVVSTSLIEAGVDLDFPVAYRALAGLDALAQVAGRCNREGRLEGHGQVYLFEEPKPCAMSALAKATEATQRLFGDALTEAPHEPTAFDAFFKEYFGSLNDRGERFLEALGDYNNIRFRTVSDAFRMIPNEGEETVFVPYGDTRALLKDAIEHGLTLARLRALRGARVQVRRHLFAALEPCLIRLRAFDPATGKMADAPYYALPDLEGLYSGKTGLNLALGQLSTNDLIDN